MSKIFVARQPIFDKKMHLYGYELFYQTGFRDNKDEDSDRESAKLVDNLLYEEFEDLIDRKRGFIGFSEKLLLSQIPLLFPKDSLVVEILESVPITDEVTAVCEALKKSGYTVAIKGFVPGEHEVRYAPVLPYVDIIKVVYSAASVKAQMQLIKGFRHKVMLIAEKLETIADYQNAVGMGFHLFQGFFFSEPVLANAQNIGSLSNILLVVINELYKEEPDYGYIAKMFESDVEMSYKLLRMANAIYYGTIHEITSIRQALVHIGTQRLIRWSHLMLIKGIANAWNEELVKASLIRGKLLSQLALLMQKHDEESDYFITGLFSSIDILLGENILKILENLPLSVQVKMALLGQDNELRSWLDALIEYEMMKWDKLELKLLQNNIKKNEFMSAYTKALKWSRFSD